MGEKGFLGYIYAAAIGVYLSTLAYSTVANNIPSISEVQKGYVVPSELEITVSDVDSDGVDQTLISYKGVSYLFQENENGDPVAVRYEIIPQNIKQYGTGGM